MWDFVPVREDRSAPALERALKPTTGDARARGAKNARAQNQNHFNGNGAFNPQNKECRTFVKDHREWFFTVAVRSGDTAFDTDATRCAVASGVADDFGDNHLHQAPGTRTRDLTNVVQCGKAHDTSTWGLSPRDEALFAHGHGFKEPGTIERRVLERVLDERAQTETAPSSTMYVVIITYQERESNDAVRVPPSATRGTRVVVVPRRKKMMPAPTERERSTRERGIDARAR